MCNKMKMRKIGQSINEYVLVIVLVTLAGIGMQTYIKRGIQGIVKTSADRLAGEKGGTVVYSGGEKSIITRYDEAGKLQWNPAAIAYEGRLSGGFFVAEKSGNEIYYNYYPDTSDLKNKIVIGGQDQASGDFTSYDWEGYVDAVYDASGTAQKLYQRVEDPVTKQITLNEVEFDIVNGIPIARKDSEGKPISPIHTGITYDKYEIVSLSSAANKSLVQNGVIEPGLVEFKYKDPLKPLTFEIPTSTPKKITVDTHSKYSGPKMLADNKWHPAMTEYKDRMKRDRIKGFIQAEIKGSKVYYYTFTTDPKDRTLVGGEDIRTHDFTEFDPDGFPVKTVAETFKWVETANKTKMREFNDVLWTYSDYVKDPKTKEIVGVIDSKGNIYRKNEIVTIRAVPATSTGPDTLDKAMRTKTINNDTTHTVGAWTAVYKLENANTFGAKDRTNPNDEKFKK